MVQEVAILGVGMHPWGKWGRNFVEYGVKAAEDALKDAGIAWTDIQYVAGGDTIRNGYPGFVAGASAPVTYKLLSEIPEPATLPLLGSGLIGLAVVVFRKRKLAA